MSKANIVCLLKGSRHCCRGYLAFLASPLVDYNDALAFIPAVPLAMRQIVSGIEAALIVVSSSRTVWAAARFQQRFAHSQGLLKRVCNTSVAVLDSLKQS